MNGNRRPRYLAAAQGRGVRAIEVIEEFERAADELVASMQTPKSRRAVKSLFKASPEQLGRAAVAAAKKQRKRETR